MFAGPAPTRRSPAPISAGCPARRCGTGSEASLTGLLPGSETHIVQPPDRTLDAGLEPVAPSLSSWCELVLKQPFAGSLSRVGTSLGKSHIRQVGSKRSRAELAQLPAPSPRSR